MLASDPVRDGPSRPKVPRLALLAAAAVLALVLADLVSLWQLFSSGRGFERAEEEELLLDRLRIELTDAETGERGFVLTGRQSYLEPLERAEKRLPRDLGRAAQLTENPAQRRRLATFAQLAAQKLADLDETVSLERAGDSRTALDRIESGVGKALMDGAKAAITTARREEGRILERRSTRAMHNLLFAGAFHFSAGLGVVWLAFALSALSRDLRRRELLEADLLEAAALRERFVGVLGHDLRTPLAAVKIGTSLLRAPGAHDGIRAKAVDAIARSAARMENMVDQLLDATRAGVGGGIPIAPRPGTDLSKVVAAVADELRLAHPEREIRLRLLGDPVGRWDGERLGQVASNLLGNALRHGEPPVVAEVRGEGEQVTLEVRNGGQPIPRELLPSLFHPFRRGHAGAGRDAGLGLGLYICKALVEAHGGSLEVRSSEGEGTTFRARLPREGPRA